MIRMFFVRWVLGCALVLSVSASAHAETAPKGFMPSSYTAAQQHAFFDAHMSVVVKEWFVDGRHPVPEVRKLMAERREQIQKRYGVAIDVRLVSNYDARSTQVKLGSFVQNGVPVFTIIVPAAMDDYANYQATGNPGFKAVFENALTVGIVHELDHLTYGSPTINMTNAALDQEEIATWAHTCEGVIRLMVEKGMPISDSDRNAYKAWVDGGKTMLSQSWMVYIKARYEHTRQ